MPGSDESDMKEFRDALTCSAKGNPIETRIWARLPRRLDRVVGLPAIQAWGQKQQGRGNNEEHYDVPIRFKRPVCGDRRLDLFRSTVAGRRAGRKDTVWVSEALHNGAYVDEVMGPFESWNEAQRASTNWRKSHPDDNREVTEKDMPRWRARELQQSRPKQPASEKCARQG